MTEADQDNGGIALTVPVFLGGLDQLFHFSLSQMFTRAQFVIWRSSWRYCPFCCCWSHQLQMRVCYVFSPSANIMGPHSCRNMDSCKLKLTASNPSYLDTRLWRTSMRF